VKNDKLTTLLLVTIWCPCQFRPSESFPTYENYTYKNK